MVFVRETSTSESLVRDLGDEETKQELIQNDNKASDVLVVNEAQVSKTNRRKGCKPPCGQEDKGLLGMLIAIVLLVLAFMFLKQSRREIEQVV